MWLSPDRRGCKLGQDWLAEVHDCENVILFYYTSSIKQYFYSELREMVCRTTRGQQNSRNCPFLNLSVIHTSGCLSVDQSSHSFHHLSRLISYMDVTCDGPQSFKYGFCLKEALVH